MDEVEKFYIDQHYRTVDLRQDALEEELVLGYAKAWEDHKIGRKPYLIVVEDRGHFVTFSLGSFARILCVPKLTNGALGDRATFAGFCNPVDMPGLDYDGSSRCSRPPGVPVKF